MKIVNAYNKAINMLLENDSNSTWDEILIENNYRYYKAHKQLVAELKETRDGYIEEDTEVYNFYDRILKVLGA